MEGEEENLHYSQLTVEHRCVSRAKDNRPYQKMPNINILPSVLSVFSKFSAVDGETSNHIDRIKGPSFFDGDYENVNSSISLCDVQSNTSAEQKGKGASWVKGRWSAEEDRKLMRLVKQYGLKKWALIAEHMVGRIGKQCRERWQNHLRPDIKKSVVWSDEEENLIIEGHEKFGNRWAEIAKRVPGRTENSIKNHWNATVRKQTSKRKIRRPERLRGLIQSTVLEEYIKKKYFNNNPNNNNNINPALAHKNYSRRPNDFYDHDSTTYFLLETFDEEMNFMKNLFANKDNPKQIINNSRNISFANLSITAQTVDVEPCR